jgi:soluble lytic murein transglycosylase-like protein
LATARSRGNSSCAIAVNGAEFAEQGAVPFHFHPMRIGNSSSDHRQQSGARIASAPMCIALGAAVLTFAVLARDPAAATRELKLAPVPLTTSAPARSTFTSLDRPARQALVTHLSHRYRIAGEAATMLVDITYETGDEIGVDPLLILAVMAIESRFNPIAESDSGAQGLMQVIPRYHLDKLEGNNREHTALTPAVNIHLGGRVLKEYIDTTGSVEAGLQKYNGALWDGSNQYAQKILAERTRYLQVLREQFTSQRHDPRARTSGTVPSSVQSAGEHVATSGTS